MTTPNALPRSRVLLGAVFGLALFVTACGGSETDASETTLPTTSETTAPATTAPAPTESTTTTTQAPAAEPVAESELPGDPFDFGPAEGSTVYVVGVAADDVLNVRRLPDASSAIITELDPTGETVLTARKRDLATSIWYEVETADGIGWANASYLAPVGGTRDATVEIGDLLGGSLPSASSTDELIDQLQSKLLAYGEEQEGPPMTATIIDGPTQGDLTEVTIDFLGYPDDAVRGDRLHIFIASEGGTTTIKSIEATSICQRGSDGAYCL